MTADQLDYLRARARHYRRKARWARERFRRVYWRAMASHLEREASELERDVGVSGGREVLVSAARRDAGRSAGE